jgi:hypothetical protein
MAVSWVARLQGFLQPAAVFYPLGYPTPYTSAMEGYREKRLEGVVSKFFAIESRPVWQGVFTDSLKF